MYRFWDGGENAENEYTAGFIRCCNSVSEMGGVAWKYMKQNPIKSGAGALLSCAAILIFSTAQNTCSTVYIDNRTWDSVLPYYSAPIGTGTHGSGFPGSDMNITLGGWTHATVKVLIDLEDYATIHVHNSGLKITTSGLPDNRAIKRQWPYVLFWSCYWQYQEYTSNNPSNSSVYIDNSTYLQKPLEGSSISYDSYLRQELPEKRTVVTEEQVAAFNEMLVGEVVVDAIDNTMKGLIKHFLLNSTNRGLEHSSSRVEEIQDNHSTEDIPQLV